MEIGLDFDGVITDCLHLKADTARKIYDIDIPPDLFKKEIVVGGGLMTLEQFRDVQWRVYGCRYPGMLMQPVASVLTYLPRLISDGHNVRIITSRDGQMLEIARLWSMQRGLHLDFTGVGLGSKFEAAHGLDVYVDDDFDKLEPMINTVQHLFLFGWRHNAAIQTGPVVQRICSWPELHAAISAI